MAVLSFNELDDLCLHIMQTRANYNNVIFSFFNDLYNLGVRPDELFDVSLWSEYSPTLYRLQPLKGNNLRYFDKSLCSSILQEAIFSGSPLYVYTSLRKQRYYCDLFNNVGQVFNGDKNVELYLYRYRYVKKLALDGATDLQIKTTMGWTNIGMVSTYKNAVLEYL